MKKILLLIIFCFSFTFGIGWYSEKGDMLKVIYDTNNDGIVDVAGYADLTNIIQYIFDGWVYTNLTKPLLSPITGTLTNVYLYVDNAPTGLDLLVDLYTNGVSVFASTNDAFHLTAGETSTNILNFSLSISKNDRIQIFIPQVGSTISGGNFFMMSIDVY